MFRSNPYWITWYSGPTSSFGRWKRDTTGATLAERAWETRNEACRLLGEAKEAGHRGIVISHPDIWYPACADCDWIGNGGSTLMAAVPDASSHDDHRTARVALRWLPPWERRHPVQIYTRYLPGQSGVWRATSWTHSPTSLAAAARLSHGHDEPLKLQQLRIRAIGALSSVPRRDQHTALAIELEDHHYGVCGAFDCDFISRRVGTEALARREAQNHVLDSAGSAS